MDLYLLAELKTISLKVTTVDMQKPPPDFRTNFEATPPPILIDRGMAILENEKIERHIMKNVPGGHNLFVQVGPIIRPSDSDKTRDNKMGSYFTHFLEPVLSVIHLILLRHD